MTKTLKWILVWILLVIPDRLTKIMAVKHLKGAEPIVLIRNVLELSYVENAGAAFGLLQNARWFFLIITLIVLAILIWSLHRLSGSRGFILLKVTLCFIGAGAIGNMIDRIMNGYVVDFIYFKLIDFPVFNLADIYVTCAAFFLAVLIFAVYKEEDFDKVFKRRKRSDKDGSGILLQCGTGT